MSNTRFTHFFIYGRGICKSMIRCIVESYYLEVSSIFLLTSICLICRRNGIVAEATFFSFRLPTVQLFMVYAYMCKKLFRGHLVS